MSTDGYTNVQNVVNIEGLFTMMEGWNESISKIIVRQLLGSIDTYWPDVTQHMQFLTEVPESISLELRQMVCFLISKCYFHLQDFYNSLNYALQSGPLFNLNENSHYVKAMIDTCIDEYKESKKELIEDSDIPEGVRNIVDFIFSQTLNSQNYSHLLGISVECNRIDLLEKAIRGSPDISSTLYHLLTLISDFSFSCSVKIKLYNLVGNLFVELNDYYGLFRCLLLKHEYTSIGMILASVCNNQLETSYQIAFDIQSLGDHTMITSIMSSINEKVIAEQYTAAVDVIRQILCGVISNRLTQNFLTRRSRHDSRLLNDYVSYVNYEDTNVQGAMLVSNALMTIGAGNEFVINNGNWIKKAENWTKYHVISSFALTHVFMPEKSLEAMKNYMNSVNPEEVAGGLYGYSILNMGNGALADISTVNRMRDAVRQNPDKEMLVHASALGLGLLFYGSGDMTLVDSLFALIGDKPFSGFGAGVGLGLVMSGNGDMTSEVEQDIRSRFLPTLRQTEHDRVATGLAIGLGLMMYDAGHSTDALLDEMLNDNNQYVRMASVMGYGMAFVGHHRQHSVISKLLRVVASDVSDVVRRNAVFALGFIHVDDPASFIPVVKLLLHSYNPHVRYGAALISGLICAGSAITDLCEPLLALLTDNEDFVVQGAAIGLGALCMECNKEVSSEMDRFRHRILDLLKNEGFAGARRADTVLARQGVLMGAGLMDAGGRNLVLQLRSPMHVMRREAVLSCALFTQFWEWYPLSDMLVKSLVPSSLMAVDTTLRMPREFFALCKCKPSIFEYVPPAHKEEDETKEKKSNVQFSFQQTRSARAVLNKSIRRSSTRSIAAAPSTSKEEKEKEEKEEKEGEKEEKKEEEKEFNVCNGSRVTLLQMPYISIPEQRYESNIRLRDVADCGCVTNIIVLKDKKPQEVADYLDLKVEGGLPDVKCPEPFIYRIPSTPVNQ